LRQAGITIAAGIDIDEHCQFPFESNLDARFIKKDIRKVTSTELAALYPKGSVRLLAGCAPCQPFSTHRRGADTTTDEKWTLLDEFSRLIKGVLPELVTMENVPGLVSTEMFESFTSMLEENGYSYAYRNCFGPQYGLAQERRRLVLVASRLGEIDPPSPSRSPEGYRTVRDALGDLPALSAGETDKSDPLHKARALTPINLARLRASKPGGTWKDWPEHLRAPCHTRKSGATFKSVYARMSWDNPSPTITTQAYNFGTGRFGHPEQLRSITLREAAILQGFPKKYKFVASKEDVQFTVLGRLIGNAVPPPLAKAIGHQLVKHVKAMA
jgi:DNA (cytosine-5)-methyltransferase 1